MERNTYANILLVSLQDGVVIEFVPQSQTGMQAEGRVCRKAEENNNISLYGRRESKEKEVKTLTVPHLHRSIVV